LSFVAEVTAIRTNICFVKAEAFVNERLVAEAQLTMALRMQENA